MKRLPSIILTVSLVLSIAFIPNIVFASDNNAKSAANLTYEQRINRLTLDPKSLTAIQKDFFEKDFLNGVQKISKRDIGNYDKLKLAFLFVSDYLSKKGSYNCNTYRGYLANALYIVGFEIYDVVGLVRSRDPNYQRLHYPKGWMTHQWVGIVIDGKSNAVITDYYNIDPKALSRGVKEKPTSGPGFFWGHGGDLDGKPLKISGEVLYLDANLYAEHGMGFEQTFLINPRATNLYSYAYLNDRIF